MTMYVAKLHDDETFRRIIRRIDTNEDGFVSLRELAEWIKDIQDNYYFKDADREFVALDADKDGFVTFNEHAKSMGLDGMPCVCVCACVRVYVYVCVCRPLYFYRVLSLSI